MYSIILDLSNCLISDEGTCYITYSLRYSQFITILGISLLDLGTNDIHAKGAKDIAKLLVLNTSLKILRAYSNRYWK